MAIVISGVNNNDKITASDGTIDLLSGVSFASTITSPDITASNRISGKFIDVNTTIQLGVSGVATATTFNGNLYGNVNNMSNLLLQIGGSEKFRVGSSGQLGIGGANYGTSGQVLTSGGSGSAATWSTITGTTINNNADNRVITGSGTANTLEAESGLTFDGTILSSDQIRYSGSGNKYNGHPRSVVIGYSGSNYANLGMGWVPTSTNDQYTSANTDYQSRLQLYDGLQIYGSGASVTSGQTVTWKECADFKPSAIKLYGDGTESLRITNDGQVKTKTLSGNLHVISSTKDGSTSARAATSAWEIKKTLGPQARTGYYYLKDPYDGTVAQWWCDMDTDGGGWILVAHVGDAAMSPQSTNAGNHWFSRNNRGGFDTIGSGYYMGGGYWRASNGSWAENTCGQLMWDVRTHGAQQDNYSVSKVVFNWGTDQALPTGASSLSNIPNASNRRFNEWCYEVVGAPGFEPANYHQNQRSNVINGQNHFTEHMVITWSFRGTGGGGDASADGPYWMIGSHHDGLHQHYEESLSGSDGVYGDGGYQVVSNEDTSWGGGASNGGYDRRSKFIDNLGTCNIWLR